MDLCRLTLAEGCKPCATVSPRTDGARGLGRVQTYSLAIVGPLRYIEQALYPVVAVFDLLTRAVSGRIGGPQSIERIYDEVE